MKRTEIALGTAAPKGRSLMLSVAKLNPEKRLELLEKQVSAMQQVIQQLQKEGSSSAYEGKKKELPIGLVCIGRTEKSSAPYFLTVREDGFHVGASVYNSLSAAAEAVSGVRRSGWTFWRTPEGYTLKEVYK